METTVDAIEPSDPVIDESELQRRSAIGARRRPLPPTWHAEDWQGEAEGPLDIRGGQIVGPEWVSGERARYPEEAKRARIQAVVLLGVLVGRAGDVRRIQVLKPLPMGLSEAAVESAKTWRFSPARLEGVAVPVERMMSVGFSLPRPSFDWRNLKEVNVYDMPDAEAERHQALLDEARARWFKEARSYELTASCYGRVGSWVRVLDGEVSVVGLKKPRPPYSAGPGPTPPGITVADLFDRAERAIFQRVNTLEVVYDSELGFPRSIEFDVGPYKKREWWLECKVEGFELLGAE